MTMLLLINERLEWRIRNMSHQFIN